MNEQQLTLTRLLGKKELSFGCYVVNKEMSSFYYKLITKVYFPGDTNENRWGVVNMNNNSVIEQTIPEEQFEIVGHPATLSDLHRWMNEKGISWYQEKYKFHSEESMIGYDSSKDLLEQSTETLDKIIELIKSNS